MSFYVFLREDLKAFLNPSLLLFMIEDAELLQDNATLTVGILIFLTTAPLSGDVVRQIIERRIILWIVYATLTIFMASTAYLFFSSSLEETLLIAKALTFIGIVGIMLAIATIVWGLPRVQRQQRS
jgi:hypothetical protein